MTFRDSRGLGVLAACAVMPRNAVLEALGMAMALAELAQIGRVPRNMIATTCPLFVPIDSLPVLARCLTQLESARRRQTKSIDERKKAELSVRRLSSSK